MLRNTRHRACIRKDASTLVSIWFRYLFWGASRSIFDWFWRLGRTLKIQKSFRFSAAFYTIGVLGKCGSAVFGDVGSATTSRCAFLDVLAPRWRARASRYANINSEMGSNIGKIAILDSNWELLVLCWKHFWLILAYFGFIWACRYEIDEFTKVTTLRKLRNTSVPREKKENEKKRNWIDKSNMKKRKTN